MKRRAWEYMMLKPLQDEELPIGLIQCDIYKEPTGFNRYYGSAIFDRPLSGTEIDHFGFDGPLPCWT